MPAVRVIQAFFPDRRPPATAALRAFTRTPWPVHAHPAQSSIQRGAFGPAAQPAFVAARLRAPHLAVSAQGASRARLPPHPATVAGPRVAPHAAALQKKAAVRAFRTPQGFLGGTGRGQPLPSGLKKQMEGYFETDFSEVRVHVGPEAGSIGALAFTVGTDLYFAPDQYQPHTQYGRELIGHELTHVVQQREGRVDNPFGDGVAVVHDEELEAEADREGRAAAQAKMRAIPRGRLPAAQSKAKGGSRGEYQLVVGAYLHQEPQPEALAGHSFVAIESPDGDRQAFGFSPAHYGRYDPKRDLGRLKIGVEGVVHDDSTAFDKPGVKTQAYSISPDQARAAMAKVTEYQSGRYRYSADQRQCATFVSDVMHAAGVASEPLPLGPRVFYEAIDSDSDSEP